MTCSNIFRKSDPLYDLALKVRLYNPAGKAKDFVLHHHAIVSDKGCPLPPKIHITDFWVNPSVYLEKIRQNTHSLTSDDSVFKIRLEEQPWILLFAMKWWSLFLFIYFWQLWVFTASHRLSLVAAIVIGRGLLIVVTSLVTEHGLSGPQASAVVAHRLGCPKARGIVPD